MDDIRATSDKRRIKTGAVLKIPAEVAVCPICGAAIYTDFDCWYLDEKEGRWQADSVNMDCETEPEDIESFEWQQWFAGHYSQPYIDWLPVEKRILEWINENYYFNLDGPEETDK
ncbi:MAG: hypothetical protein GWN55_07455 [Phycisphaerae bacterium]|nr:hypothetical protein [Phycisphaerae bacterium]NIS25144.1 hypothetical protein [candidate division KSB1 bacterium]NIP55682.1 hypothetical protein [Phycisphaerae bacterium]NIS50779.1 hypothetical protein [Phycisphaerae bacterium]NIU25846.1 hypothetical protein [candidate division KSB1 bacterium]